MSVALPALWRPRAARLFIDVQHGLSNRLRALVSAAAIAARTDRELVVVWCPDHHCEAQMLDLLCYDGPVIADREAADLCRAAADRVYNYMEIEPGARFQEPILDPAEPRPAGDVYVRSAYTLTSPHLRHEDEQHVLRRLSPAPMVRDLARSVRHPNQVALHVRSGTGPEYDHLSYESAGNWPAERHAELLAWRAQSQPARFLARLEALIRAGQADTVFLATDLPDTYALFADRLGGRLVHLPRPLFDRSAAQLPYALADLMLLSAAGRFLASTGSSFSDLAQRLARPGRPVEKSGADF